MTILARAGAALRTAHKKLDPHSVTVSRGSLSFAAIATLGETRTEEVLNDEYVVSTRVRNVFIDVASYDFGGGPVEPEVGDRILCDGIDWVITEDFTDAAWRWSDRERTYYRINVVEVKR